MFFNNELVPMTRRYPELAQKVLRRDAYIAKRIIIAWDIEHNAKKVLDIFLKEKGNLSDYRYWELLRTVWIVCGTLENAPVFRKLLQSNRKHRHFFSTPEEASELRAMNDEITVYRACNEENDGGLSWTTSRGYAERYKDMYKKAHLVERTVHKLNVFAYINRNLESEIIIL